MHWTGIILGWVIFLGYLYGVMNYFVKRVNKDLVLKLPPDSHFRKRFGKFTYAVVGGHIYVPLFLATIILLHLMIELMHKGFFITGVIVFCLITAQISIGAYGAFYRDKKSGPWLRAHRTIAVLLFFAIAAHVVTVIILKP